jgi:hypothetical protein
VRSALPLLSLARLCLLQSCTAAYLIVVRLLMNGPWSERRGSVEGQHIFTQLLVSDLDGQRLKFGSWTLSEELHANVWLERASML